MISLDIAKLGALNCVWVIVITVNSRIVNGHGATFVSAALTQLVVSLAYFTVVKSIQRADGWRAKAAYVVGGAIGGGIGVVLTTWTR